MTLLLSNAEVRELLDLPDAIRITERILGEQASGAIASPPPFHVDVGAGALRVVSGAVPSDRHMGLRVTGANTLAGRGSTALLYDTETSELLSVMAYPFGTMRTAAVFGVATDVLAPPDASTLAMIGTGRNALGLLEAARHVRPVERIAVYGRDEQRREAFVAEARERVECEVRGAASMEDALGDAAIVYVSTSALAPVITAEDVEDDAFVASMGTPAELDRSIYLAADVVVISLRENEERYTDVYRNGSMRHTLLELDASGELPWSSVRELCEVRAEGTPPGSRRTVFKESQGGFGDVAFAGWIYDRARERGLGSECQLH